MVTQTSYFLSTFHLVFLAIINYNILNIGYTIQKNIFYTEKRELMDFLDTLLNNKVLIAAVAGWFTAQVLKTIIHLIITKKFVAERLVGSGGMPSSHSATVCALTTSIFLEQGPGSVEFAISLMLAIIVMHDARGVRRETGIQAKVLNEMLQFFEDMGSDMPPQDKLKEFVGHTPFQVLIGGLLGIAIAVVLYL